jgi:hypothetical protein
MAQECFDKLLSEAYGDAPDSPCQCFEAADEQPPAEAKHECQTLIMT